MLSADNFYGDISSNNGSFNAAQYKSAGHRVIAIKATEGTGYVNPDYSGWVHTAHEHGLSVLHYHFARPENGDPNGQVKHFWNVVREHFVRPGDYVFFDVETGPVSEAHAWLKEADSHMSAIGHVHPWVYCPLSYYESGGLEVASRNFVIAAWGTHKPTLRKGDNIAGWQYGDGRYGPNGYPRSFAGIPGTADSNLLSPSLVKYYRKIKR